MQIQQSQPRTKPAMRNSGSGAIAGILLLQSITQVKYCRALQRNGKGTTRVTPPRRSTLLTDMDEEDAVGDGDDIEQKKKLIRSVDDHDEDDTAKADTVKTTVLPNRLKGTNLGDEEGSTSLPKVLTVPAGKKGNIDNQSIPNDKDKTKRKKKKHEKKDLRDEMIKDDVNAKAEMWSDQSRRRHGEEIAAEQEDGDDDDDDDSSDTTSGGTTPRLGKEANQITDDSAERTPLKSKDSTLSPMAERSRTNGNTSLPQSTRILRQIPPPNSLYRFFLTKGIIGRLLVMLFILITELVSAFIPTFGNAIKAILPLSLTNNYRESSGKSSNSSSSSRRTNNRRNKSEQRRRADLVALEQLQRAKKEGGKYRHVVSPDFMQRHEIGMYAATAATTHDDDDDESAARVPPENSANRNGEENRPIASAVKDEEDDDASWIIEALSSEKPLDNDTVAALEKEEKQGQGQTSITTTTRTNKSRKGHGGNVAKEYSQRESRVHAAIQLPHRKKKRKRNSFGSILLGQLASSDNRFSRNLLGAYPGDAVPLEQAASASGLSELARRYGWGDWPEEDDNDDGTPNGSKAGRRKRKRQPRATAASNRVSFEFAFGASNRDHPRDDFDGWNPPFPEISSITRSRQQHSRFERNSIVAAEMESLGGDDGEDETGILSKTRPRDVVAPLKASTEELLNPTYRSSKRTRPATEVLTERRTLLQEKKSPD
jgi:hypothetical protein